MAFACPDNPSENFAFDPSFERISVFGLGNLGLPLAALFARSGLTTVGIDTNADLLAKLRAGKVSIGEHGIDDLLAAAAPSITYRANASAAADTDASIILVETQSDEGSGYYSKRVEEACTDLCSVLRARPVWRYHLVVISSTLLPGSSSTRIIPLLSETLGRRPGVDFGVAYVPQFVTLGDVVRDIQHPPILLVGTDDDAAASARAAALYRRIVMAETPLVMLSLRDAELTKVALNLFLCMKISFANFLAQLCETAGGADLDAIADALSRDARVGKEFLRAGTPYGGPCLPHDTDAFMHLAQEAGLDAPLARACAEINRAQFEMIENCVLDGEPGCVGVLGLALKAGMPITRGSPAFEFVRRLLRRNIRVVAFDPLLDARVTARATFGSSLACYDSLSECIAAADTILICNPDPLLAGVAAHLPANRKIVDPWGIVSGTHPGLVRPGRRKQNLAIEEPRAFVTAS